MAEKNALDLIGEYGGSSGSELEEEDEPREVPHEAASSCDQVPTKKSLTKRQTQHQLYVERRKSQRTVIFADCSCKLKCPSLISKNRKLEINETYWSMPPAEQRNFILQHTIRDDVKRRRVEPDIAGFGYKRSGNLVYKLADENSNIYIVCSLFFLNTLGYNKNCNNFVYRAYAAVDQNLSVEEVDPKEIKPSALEVAVRTHIASYHPTISHYRREHAPNALYLPSDLTCKSMHDDFNENRQEKSLEGCSYSYYTSVVRAMKIRFTKLGNELCEICREAENHMKESGHRKHNKEEQQFRNSLPVDNEHNEILIEPSESESENHDDNGEADEGADCEKCSDWLKHRQASIASRQEYEKDKLFEEGLVVSVDLQKVVQLPRMEGFKQAIFAKRIVALNETFAPLGGGTNGKVHAVLWNETVSGRKAPDLASAFQKHLIANASARRIVYWLDNCSSQNKNWDLIIHMILFVNSRLTQTNEIVFKYLEPGHTFMTADSFHASVERTMKKKERGEVHTFDDFVTCVQDANVEVPAEVTVMKFSDFFTPTIQFKPSVLAKIKPRPFLNEIKLIRFKRGSLDFTFKTCFSGEFRSVSIFTKAQLNTVQKPTFSLLNTLTFNTADRGIEKSRKDLIIKKLCPLMPAEKRQFWIDLPVNDNLDEF